MSLTCYENILHISQRAHGYEPSRGGVLLEILGMGVPSGSPNPNPISSETNAIFLIHFQTTIHSQGYHKLQTKMEEQNLYRPRKANKRQTLYDGTY